MGKKIKGFTLAEILVTLGVIGVIASMTVPTLVQDIQDAQFKTAWKKTFADLNQATQRVTLLNAGTLKGAFSDSNELRNAYIPYLNYIKSCNHGNSIGTCWASITKYLDGTVKTDMSNPATLVLNNGSSVQFNFISKDCSSNWGNVNGQCAWLIVDTNGSKEPNRIGKDVYYNWLLESTIKPFGIGGDYREGRCEGSTGWDSGLGCAAKFLFQ